MRILVDADACPVKDIIIDIAKVNNIEVYMLFDLSHEYQSENAHVIFCDSGKDSVDLKLLSLCQKEDIVVTQDYGLASLALIKGAKVLHVNGFVINENNINALLTSRHEGQKRRKVGHVKGPKKRNKSDDVKFQEGLIKLVG